MKNINLLPKIPYIQKIFVPALVSTISLFVLLAGTILFMNTAVRADLSDKSEKIEQINAALQKLTVRQQQDAMTMSYQALNGEVSKLKQARMDWIPFFDLISSNLPKTARLLQAEIPKDANEITGANSKSQAVNVNLSVEFAELGQSAEYILLLQRSALIHSVSINSVVKTQRTFGSPAISPQMGEELVGRSLGETDAKLPGSAVEPSAQTYEVYRIALVIQVKTPEQEK